MLRGKMTKKQSAHAYIGTSGWSYSHWKENFYPEGLKQEKWLMYYSETFQTVEINNTFYHLPTVKTIDKWYSQVPQDFSFSIKASRYITHVKRLKDPKETLEKFFTIIKGLKTKVGPILFQLPPSLKCDIDRFKEFIDCLPIDQQCVFEFRHPSWFIEEIYDLMANKKIALCITDLNGSLSPLVITSNFTYIRLHGPKKAYQGSYGAVRLKSWKKKIQDWLSNNISVYCYFDNDEKGYAIQDASSLLTSF